MTTFEVDPGRSGEDVTEAQQLLLFENPDARAAREAAARNEIPYPQEPLRGKHRDLGLEAYDEPWPIAQEDIRKLGKLLSAQPAPVLDDLNKSYSPYPSKDAIERYIVFAGAAASTAKREREAAQARLEGTEPPKPTPEQRHQKRLALIRKPQIIADKLQRILRNNVATARVRQTALIATRTAYQKFEKPDETTARYAADAIEDLGACIYGDDNSSRYGDGIDRKELGFAIALFGYHAGKNPELLAEQPLLLLLGLREQERRLPHFQERLTVLLSMDEDRRTLEDKANELATEHLIAGFAIHGALQD